MISQDSTSQNFKNITDSEYFDKNLNISYIPPNTPKPDNKIILKHYFSSIQIYGLIVILYWLNPFFSNILTLDVKMFFNLLFIIYIFVAPLCYFIFRPKSIWHSHNIEICQYLCRIFSNIKKLKIFAIDDIKNSLDYFKPTYLEKQSMMLMFIKMFFGPLMILGVFSNIQTLKADIPTFKTIINTICNYLSSQNNIFFWKAISNQYRQFLYNRLIIILFTIDISIFSVGYLSELSILKNKIRTVETTPAGIFFCLLCYPPFVEISNSFLGWNQTNAAIAFGNDNSILTWTIRLIAIFFITIYVAASVALGTKGSNLTNRGTVSCFPYNIIRHPAYVCKNLFWIITTIPIFMVDFSADSFSITQYITKLILTTCATLMWALIYYFRAITEERHLIKDPQYQEYVKRVKYRFIPGII